MSMKLLFSFIVLVAAMMGVLWASAAEAYANYTSSNTTMTFYYDNYRSSCSGQTFDLNTGDDGPGWYDEVTCYNNDITWVVFNPSLAEVKPDCSAGRFMGTGIKSVAGLTVYAMLKTSSTRAPCCRLASHSNESRLTYIKLKNNETFKFT